MLQKTIAHETADNMLNDHTNDYNLIVLLKLVQFPIQLWVKQFFVTIMNNVTASQPLYPIHASAHGFCLSCNLSEAESCLFVTLSPHFFLGNGRSLLLHPLMMSWRHL